MPSDTPVTDELRRLLSQVLRGIEKAERRLDARERAIQSFLDELDLLGQDLVHSDTSSRYSMPSFEEKDGDVWVVAESLPRRELQVMQTLQKLSEGGRVVVATNSELLDLDPQGLSGMHNSSLSACLTRMQHRNLIELRYVDGVRHVVLKSRLSSQDQ